MQFDSYIRFIAATMGLFGVLLTILGVICLKVNRGAGLLAVPWGELSVEQLKKLIMQKSLLVSGLTLAALALLGLILPWVLNLAERRVLDPYYGVAIYAAVALGMVISLFVYGFIVAFNEHRMEKRKP